MRICKLELEDCTIGTDYTHTVYHMRYSHEPLHKDTSVLTRKQDPISQPKFYSLHTSTSEIRTPHSNSVLLVSGLERFHYTHFVLHIMVYTIPGVWRWC